MTWTRSRPRSRGNHSQRREDMDMTEQAMAAAKLAWERTIGFFKKNLA